MKHGHFPAFFSILRVLFRQWGEFLDFGEGIDRKEGNKGNEGNQSCPDSV
jgi:hypothetical protein